jgi:hypothetical protein
MVYIFVEHLVKSDFDSNLSFLPHPTSY